MPMKDVFLNLKMKIHRHISADKSVVLAHNKLDGRVVMYIR